MVSSYRKSAATLLLVLAIVSASVLGAGAQTFKVLYNFTNGTDGGGVWSNVVMDARGNLYGTTSGGGAYGYGTVFELSPGSGGTWTETVLHSFMKNDPDGEEPMANLILDSSGNLYGTTPTGGKYHVGTVFELSPGAGGWTLTLLHSMGAYKGDASPPRGGLLIDSKGNLYGAGGTGTPGAGAVYEVSHGSGGWTERVIYNFGSDDALGHFPVGNLTFDSTGNLYGLTLEGGDLSCSQGDGGGCGVVYKLWRASGWKETVLHSFTGNNDGAKPGNEQLVFDGAGNLYGSTLDGGGTGCNVGSGCGAVFKMTEGASGWREGVIYQFGNGSNGAIPVGGLVFDSAGNAYGTTGGGGSSQCSCGVVYKLAPGSGGQWKYSVLHTFSGPDGEDPSSALIIDGEGNLYGTAAVGGAGGGGVVFEITH